MLLLMLLLLLLLLHATVSARGRINGEDEASSMHAYQTTVVAFQAAAASGGSCGSDCSMLSCKSALVVR